MRLQIIDSAPPGNGRHNRNIITVFHGGGVFLQVADVLFVQINIDESAQFAFIGIKMAAQIRMLSHQLGQRSANGYGLNIDRGLLAGILPQRRRNMDLRHG